MPSTRSPNIADVVPVSVGNQVINKTPAQAIADGGPNVFTPTKDISITFNGQIIQFFKDTPYTFDAPLGAFLTQLGIIP